MCSCSRVNVIWGKYQGYVILSVIFLNRVTPSISINFSILCWPNFDHKYCPFSIVLNIVKYFHNIFFYVGPLKEDFFFWTPSKSYISIIIYTLHLQDYAYTWKLLRFFLSPALWSLNPHIDLVCCDRWEGPYTVYTAAKVLLYITKNTDFFSWAEFEPWTSWLHRLSRSMH